MNAIPFNRAWRLRILAVAVVVGFSAFRLPPGSTPGSAASDDNAAGVDAAVVASRLVDAIIQIESGGDPRRVGRHGERGLMQIRSGTWRDMTARLYGAPLPFDQAFDPEINRRVGMEYLATLQATLRKNRDQWKADERTLLLAAYNAGPGRLRTSGFDPDFMPRQTRDYVERASALHDALLQDLAEPVRLLLLASL